MLCDDFNNKQVIALIGQVVKHVSSDWNKEVTLIQV